MIKQKITKRTKLVPIPTDKPLYTRLLRAFVIGLGVFVAIMGMTMMCMRTILAFGGENIVDPMLVSMAVVCSVVVFAITLYMESEGSYKIVEDK